MRARPSSLLAASLAVGSVLVAGALHAQPAPQPPPGAAPPPGPARPGTLQPQPSAPPPAAQPPAQPPPAMQPQQPPQQPPPQQPPPQQPPPQQPPPQQPPPGAWSPPPAGPPSAGNPGGWAPPLGAPGTRGGYDLSERFIGFPPGYAPRKIPSDGASPPPGYVLGSEPRPGLWVTGVAVFAGAYGISILAAGTAVSEGDDEAAPMFIPVIGPWVTVRTTDADAGLRSALVIDGIAQLTGVALFISGMAAQRDVFERADTVRASAPRPREVEPSAPKVGIGPGRVAVVGDF